MKPAKKLKRMVARKDPKGLPLLMSELRKRKKLKRPTHKPTCADTNFKKYSDK